MFFMKPFKSKATRGEAGNMLLITGVIASAIAVTGGKVMLDRSTAQRKANQMAENMKRAKEIPGSAAMVAKSLISVPPNVAASKSTEWNTGKLVETPTNMPLIYPIPYVSGEFGSSARAADKIYTTGPTSKGVNWELYNAANDGSTATVKVYTNDSTRAKATDVSQVLKNKNSIVDGGNQIARTESLVTYEFRNCDSFGKTSTTFTGRYCARAKIKSLNYASSKKGSDKTLSFDEPSAAPGMINEATAELGMIEPPPAPTCKLDAAKKILPAVVRPGESFSIDLEASGVVVGYFIMHAEKCVYDSTGADCKGNGSNLKSLPWNQPHKTATHTISNIPTSLISSELGQLIAANDNQAKFEVTLIGIGGSTSPSSCSAIVTLPGPVSCVANSFEVTRTGDDSRTCDVTLKKDQGEGSVEKIFVEGTKQTQDCHPDRLPGDANLDGKVDGFDLVAIKAAGKFNAGGGNAQWSQGDFNCDGKVDAIDLVLASSNYGVTQPSSPAPGAGDLNVQQDKPGFDASSTWKSSFPCSEDPFSFSAWFDREVHGVKSESYCSPVSDVSELGPSCSGIVSYDRTLDGMCILKLSRTSKSHSKVAVIVGDGKIEDLFKPGSWNGLEWTSQKFSCDPFPHTITPELSKVTVNGVRQTTGQDGRPSCGSKTINISAQLCVNTSTTVTRNQSNQTMCKMTVMRAPFVQPTDIKDGSTNGEVRMNYVKANGSWSGALWTSQDFSCAAGGNYVGQLVGRDNKAYDCGTDSLEALQYSLTTSVTGSGSISKTPGSTTYAHGSTVTLTATPATGYSFTSWSGACSGTATTCTVTMDGNKAVVANFASADPPVCTISAQRTQNNLTQCNVMITRGVNSGPIDTVTVNGLSAGGGSWSGSTYTVQQYCPLAGINFSAMASNMNGGANCGQVAIPGQCTQAVSGYTPETVNCSISINGGGGWANQNDYKTRENRMINQNAKWIAPNQQVSNYCPAVSTSQLLMYVSNFTTTGGTVYNLEYIIDNAGEVFVWKNGDPNDPNAIKIGFSGCQAGGFNDSKCGSKKQLTLVPNTRYSLVITLNESQPQASGNASGVVMTIHDSNSAVVKSTASDNTWCVFRKNSWVWGATAEAEVKSFVPAVAGCKSCFRGIAP
jgi:hypothetical protein